MLPPSPALPREPDIRLPVPWCASDISCVVDPAITVSQRSHAAVVVVGLYQLQIENDADVNVKSGIVKD